MTATGLPGRPKNGVLPIWPNVSGRPGLIATLEKWMVPSLRIAAIT